MNRRIFVGGLGLGSLGAVAARPAIQGAKVIDAHAHLHHHARSSWSEDDRKLIDAADKLGIDQLCCSMLPPERPAKPEGFRECNRWVAEAMRRFPGRILGYCFVNPGYAKEAHDEIRRCVEERGFIGVKLYNDYRATEPVVFPIVELAIELRFPILHHAGHVNWLQQPQPRISDGGHFAELARRYPEAMLICGHICGGGDWEWTIKALRNAPSVFLDTSGSVADEGVVEMAVRTLGADRLLFACDMSMTASVGRIRGADISEADRRKILGANMQRILSRERQPMIDVNAYLGHFAFRQLRHNTADGLLRLMDRKRIERALVSSAASITYRNAHAGNEEVAAEIKRHRDRLIGCAVLNPSYAGWQDDLKTCHEEFGMKALRLYPRWHNYKLTDAVCRELVQQAAQRGLAVTIPLRAEDRRQQSWLVDIPDVSLDEIAALIKAVPQASFMLLNGSGFGSSPLGRKNNGLPANYAIDISLLTAELANEVGQLLSNLGDERVVFGTGMPFHYADPALTKLEILDASEAVKEKIRRGNALRMLKL